MLLRYHHLMYLISFNCDKCAVLNLMKNKAETLTLGWLFLGVPLVGNLRTRLLALHVLEAVLPACEANMEDDQVTQVCYYHYTYLLPADIPLIIT